MQGNRKLYRKLILSFADSCRESMGLIERAIESRNHAEIMQLAHSIKGSAGNLAAKEIQAAAMFLEHLVKNSGDGSPSAEALTEAFEKLTHAAAAMRAAVETLEGRPDDKALDKAENDLTASIPPGDRQALASQIREAADMGDMTELQSIAAELETQFGEQQVLSRKIAALVDVFDLDGCVQLAEKLMDH